MRVENSLEPTPEQFAFLAEEGAPDRPIVMVNLLKFRKKAAYPDGRDAELSGREAYFRYGMAVAQILLNLGGKIIFNGKVTGLLIGRVDELWDEVALAQYPNRRAMFDMVNSPEYRDILVHRTAGLEGQLNIEVVSTLPIEFAAAR